MKKGIKAAAAVLAASAVMTVFSSAVSAEVTRYNNIGIDDEGIVHIYNEDDTEKGLFSGYVQIGKQRSYYREGVCVASRWMKIDGKKRFYADNEGIVLATVSKDRQSLYLIDEIETLKLPRTQDEGVIELVVLYGEADMFICTTPDATESEMPLYIILGGSNAASIESGSVIKIDHDGIYSVEEDGFEVGVVVQNTITPGDAKIGEGAASIIELIQGADLSSLL